IAVQHELVRHHRADLLARRREDVRRRLVETHHLHGTPAGLDRLADRVDAPEDAARLRLLNHDHWRAAAHLGLREPAALGELAALHLLIAVVRAESGDELCPHALVFEPQLNLRPDSRVPDLRQLGDAIGLFGTQVRANANPLGRIVRIHGRRREHLDHVERRRAGDLDRIEDLVADALHDRRHRHHGGHADHDAEDREPRAQLAHAQGVEGDRDVLAQLVERDAATRTHHSARSAVIGSSRAARRAGYTPNSTPTDAPSVTATSTDHPVIRAGSGETAATSSANPQPLSTPSTPPVVASTIASARNWRSMSRERAPTAFRIPISRVRSETDISMMFMITMPPTTMPIATTAGITLNSTAVSCFQKSTSAAAVSSEKLFSCPGRRRCAARIASSARSIALSTSFASRIFTEIVVVRRRPYSIS